MPGESIAQPFSEPVSPKPGSSNATDNRVGLRVVGDKRRNHCQGWVSTAVFPQWIGSRSLCSLLGLILGAIVRLRTHIRPSGSYRSDGGKQHLRITVLEQVALGRSFDRLPRAPRQGID